MSHTQQEKSIRNLDQASREAATGAKDVWFVACTSTKVVRGVSESANQSNGFEQSPIQEVCKKRHAGKMHGLAINWGPIDYGKEHQRSDHETGKLLSLEACLRALDKAMCQDAPIVSISSRQEENKQGTEPDGEAEAKESTLTDMVLAILGLKVRPTEQMTLLDAGIDSLGTTEVGQLLEKQVGVTLENAQVRTLTFKKLREMAPTSRILPDRLRSESVQTAAFTNNMGTHQAMNGGLLRFGMDPH
ncbi:hypothetical protein EGW08_000016 [Elysia chlorotica]|uniref:Carrier domain-containing protein n=1 Tax=Elysia chlorotica TaxID=188477 RepID=A0A433UEJ6_ELYCH|nr:hypothetical protein EGW08_000016 [Elysia chlorotica]